MVKIGVLVSGGGTNLQQLIDAQARGGLGGGRIVTVISSRPGVFALERAKNAGIEAVTLSRKDYPDVEAYSQALIDALQKREVELVVRQLCTGLPQPRHERAPSPAARLWGQGILWAPRA